MNFRAVVQDGLIVVNKHGALPDGTRVEVSVMKGQRKSGAAVGKKVRKSASRRTPGYGMWADRDELGAPEEAVDRLRALTRRRKVC